MPMLFPDMGSLERRAVQRKFRTPFTAESQLDYREALATHVQKVDMIEAGEIRLGIGYDVWTMDQRAAVIKRTTGAQIREVFNG